MAFNTNAAIAVHLTVSANAIALFNLMVLEHIAKMEEFKRCSEYLPRRKVRKRIVWSEFRESLLHKHFHQMFRISHKRFDSLCNVIEEDIGEHKFKSELYLKEEYKKTYMNWHRLHRATKASCGGCILGEVKLAITL